MSRRVFVVCQMILLGVFLPGCSQGTAGIEDLSSSDLATTAHPQLPPDDVGTIVERPVEVTPVDVPFPNRTNPFQARATDSGRAVSVRVAGFTHAGDEPRTVLLIDEQVVVLSQNEERRGVRVSRIAPPLVVVQQNGIERQLSLTDSHVPSRRVLR